MSGWGGFWIAVVLLLIADTVAWDVRCFLGNDVACEMARDDAQKVLDRRQHNEERD